MATESRDSSSALTGQTSVIAEQGQVRESSPNAGRRAVPRALFSGGAHASKDGAASSSRWDTSSLRKGRRSASRRAPRSSFLQARFIQLERAENGQMSMTVEFMGMCAAISVMPAPYTEFLLDRIAAKRSCHGRVSQHLQPSHDFVLLQRLGEVSLLHRV